jgi:phosphoenolpyruvate carboxylase
MVPGGFAGVSSCDGERPNWAGAPLLGDNPSLARSIRNRFPYLDPLHAIQVDLLRQLRSGVEDPRLVRVIQLTLNGIAAGLRNSG